ncbi:hypothetical protein PQX77_012732 [Marasmius sp. AFHP31]|nr:hypothetical protein PQX77_012732 [Marasmius sp. AFHP31]
MAASSVKGTSITITTSSANARMFITQGTSSTTMTVHIDGDQNNHIVRQRVKEHTEFDDVSRVVPAKKREAYRSQFRNLRRGDICRLKDTDLAVSPEAELTTRKDHVVNERTGAEHEGEFKGIKRREQRLDQALLEQCTTLSTLTAERPSLPSISETDSVSNSTSLNVVLPTPSFPTSPISTYIDPTTMSITDAPTNAGWSATSHSTNNNDPCNALAGASDIDSAVSYPPDSTIHTPVYSTSTVEYTIADASLTRPPVSVARQHWIPRPFISNIRPIAHRSSWPVLATSGSPTTRNEDDSRCNDDGKEEVD